jgi:hypothetical protein
MVMGYVPPLKAAGVPLKVAVPLPLSVKVTPVGKLPVMLNEGVGEPVLVIVNEPADPTLNVVLLRLVMAADEFTAKGAEAVLPVPPLAEETAAVTFVKLPMVEPVTLTEKLQTPFVASVAPVSDTLPEPAIAVIVPPPQLPISPLGVARKRFAGSVSVKATPVSAAVFAAGFVIVKVSEVVPFGGMFETPNDLLIEGAASTARFADAVPPAPPFAEVTAPVVLLSAPVVVPVTFTVKLHEELAPRIAPARITLAVPCVAVMVPPPQVPVSPLGVATTKPEGKVSVKPTPVSDVPVLGFDTVKVNVVLPPSGTVAAPKDFVIVGTATTVTDAFEVLPAPAVVEVTETLLFFTPAVVPMTFTLKVHDPLAANVAPDRLALLDPAVAVIVPPPQLPLSPFGVATTRPEGKLSVNATPVSEIELAIGLVIVKLSEVEPFREIVAAPNDFAIVGGDATLRLAVAVLPVPPFVELTALVVFV